MTPSATPPQQPPAAAGTAAALPYRGHPVRGGRATGAEPVANPTAPPRSPGDDGHLDGDHRWRGAPGHRPHRARG